MGTINPWVALVAFLMIVVFFVWLALRFADARAEAKGSRNKAPKN